VLDFDPVHQGALGALERLYTGLERWSELVQVFEVQLSRAQDGEEKIRLLAKTASIYENEFDSSKDAAACYERAMTMFVGLGDRHGEAWVRFQIAVLQAEQGELTKARVGLEEALAAFRELGDRRGEAWTQRRLGTVHAARGDLDRAASWLDRSLVGLRQLGDRSIEAMTLQSLGELHLRRDESGKARWLFQESLAVARELDEAFIEAQTLRSLGDLHHLEADHDEAACYLKASVEIWRKLDMPLELARTLQRLGQADLDAGSPAAAESAWQEALTLFERGTPEAEQVTRRLELLEASSCS